MRMTCPQGIKNPSISPPPSSPPVTRK
jgi:hypothetical protein